MSEELTPIAEKATSTLKPIQLIQNHEDLKDEYFDISENVRHWSNLRFAQLTVFIAITAALISAFVQPSSKLSLSMELVIKIAGLLIVIIFWVVEERTMKFWRNFVNRAAELENTLNFKQYKTRPIEGFISSANAIRLLFILLLSFWIVTLIWW